MEENKTKKCGRKATRKTSKDCTGNCSSEKCSASADAAAKLATKIIADKITADIEAELEKTAPEATPTENEDIIEKLLRENILTPESLCRALDKVSGKGKGTCFGDLCGNRHSLKFEEDTETAITHGVYDGKYAASRVIDIEGVGQLIALPLPDDNYTAYFWIEDGKITVPVELADALEPAVESLGLDMVVVGAEDADTDDFEEDDCDEEQDVAEQFGELLERVFKDIKGAGCAVRPRVKVIRL